MGKLYVCLGCSKTFENTYGYKRKRKYCCNECKLASPIWRKYMRRQVSKSLKGIKHPAVSKQLKEMWANPELRRKRSKKISEARLRQWQNPEFRKRMCKVQQKHYAEHPERKARQSVAITKDHNKPKNRKHYSDVTKEHWKDPEITRRRMKGMHAKPNEPEKRLRRILNKMFPNEYKYVGSGQVVIDGLNPDFININGQKKIIELFGVAFHTDEEIPVRSSRFAKYGYSMHVVWDIDLKKNREQVKQELTSFHNQEILHNVH